MQLSNLNTINASDGHTNGNWLISEFSTMLEDVSENYGYVGRNGGNEFIILIEDCDSTKADMFLLDLGKRIHGYNGMKVGSPVEVSYARTLNCDEHKEKISDLVSLGYRKLRETPQILS
jgi:GGDEF domain-containing protein